ncbi:MAG TPA: histidine phosphatase family protein [Candidatus Limnocylindrales bacterium]|nr:histidine phosphatase family protein [Candidatus Limnocylindrales bacterium]
MGADLPDPDGTHEGRPRAWLIRHGETAWARDGRHTSRTDVPLTELGRTQAVAAGRKIAGQTFAEVLSSPMSRALDTARIAGFGERVEVDDDLHEWEYGGDEGRTTPEIRADRPDWTIWADGPRGGETIDQVAARADRIIARVLAASGDVLLFAHGHVLRVLAARWLALEPVDGRLFALSTATVSVLGWEREQHVILRWNEPCGPGA